DWFTSQAFTRTGLADLPAHLQQHYGIAVAGVTELDIGVYRVIRADGQTGWPGSSRRRGRRPLPNPTPGS
ncbi:MAG TPA: hypothetical protein VHZ03_13160, partial [Trebonia sp.]|nr:hypothetical protein [Trebonia sp.]